MCMNLMGSHVKLEQLLHFCQTPVNLPSWLGRCTCCDWVMPDWWSTSQSGQHEGCRLCDWPFLVLMTNTHRMAAATTEGNRRGQEGDYYFVHRAQKLALNGRSQKPVSSRGKRVQGTRETCVSMIHMIFVLRGGLKWLPFAQIEPMH